MRSRLSLHEELVKVLGSRNVYFQPPESIKMTYPCIIYELYDISNTAADDDYYLDPRQYRVTIVDTNPDSLVRDKMAKFKSGIGLTKFVRSQVINNLYHYTYNIYY